MSYPIIFQDTYFSCGPTCICMLCKFYHIAYTEKEIFTLAKTTSKGTSIWNMKKTLGTLGFSCVAASIEDFYKYDYSFPTIALTAVGCNMHHYVVIYKKNDNYIIIGDPARGLQHIEIKKFLLTFTKVLIIPKPKI